MEGLPYDFGIEDDSEDEGESAITEKKPSKSLLEAIKAEIEPKKTEDKETEKTKEKLIPDEEVFIDVAPELDGEAPLEHLSLVENQAITQTLASERLNEIDHEDISSEQVAAESFLEAVEASGDIDMAYQEVLMEIGEAAIDSGFTLEDMEAETALPIDPESLLEEARNELSPNVTYSLREEEPMTVVNETVAPEKTTNKKRQERLRRGLVDYVVGRRQARLSEQAKPKDIEEKLEVEISGIKLQLRNRETNVRELAKNKAPLQPEKAHKAKKSKEVVTDPEKPKATHEIEKAAISAHTMTKAELLKLASKIEVHGSTLRHLYESSVIGEKGLRRITAEYLRGGNFNKALRREVLEKEKDFERDPLLRDQGSRNAIDSKPVDLDSLLSKTGINWDEPTEEPKEPKAKTLEEFLRDKDNKKINHPVRRIVDVLIIGALVALTTTIALLAVSR